MKLQEENSCFLLVCICLSDYLDREKVCVLNSRFDVRHIHALGYKTTALKNEPQWLFISYLMH